MPRIKKGKPAVHLGGKNVLDSDCGMNIGTIITMLITANNWILAPMISPASCGFPSPSFRPSKTVVPTAMPVIKEVISTMSQLPVETAEASEAAVNRPPTIMSTAPYMVCSRFAARTGRVNYSRGANSFPAVKF